jgi:cytosine deaminase
MAVHVAQMTGLDAMAACFAAVTAGAARLLHLEDYGLAPGCRADMVLLDAHDPVEAIRLRATRLKVIRQGKVIAETPMQRSLLALPGRPEEVSFLWPPPKP